MNKKNKAQAREWYNDRRQEEREREQFDQEMEVLRYAGCKREGTPDPEVFERRGMKDVALKIRQASGLLEDAYNAAQRAVEEQAQAQEE